MDLIDAWWPYLTFVADVPRRVSEAHKVYLIWAGLCLLAMWPSAWLDRIRYALGPLIAVSALVVVALKRLGLDVEGMLLLAPAALLRGVGMPLPAAWVRGFEITETAGLGVFILGIALIRPSPDRWPRLPMGPVLTGLGVLGVGLHYSPALVNGDPGAVTVLLGALAAFGLTVGLPRLRLPRSIPTVVLALLVVASMLNYARWGPRLATERVDSYDVIHYYLNAKYFDELGYLDLYPACLLADAENSGPFFKGQGNRYMAQDDGGHVIRPISHAVARGRQIREERFTPERWKQFEHDFLYLQRERFPMGDNLWRQMIQDHGFNGTPVWTMLARPFAELVPVESIKWLGYLDVVLLGVGFAALGWAYGSTTLLWALFFFTVSYSLRWPTVSWVFLRYDWVAALMLAMAMLKKKRPYLAGLFAGWAATLRLFPAFWMWGPFSKGLARVFTDPDRRRFGPVVLGALFVVGGVGLLGYALFVSDSELGSPRGIAKLLGAGVVVLAGGGLAGSRFSERLRAARDLTSHAVFGPLLALAFGWIVAVGVLEAGANVAFGPSTTATHMENMLDHNRAEQLSSRRIGLALALPFRGPFETRNPADRHCKHVPCKYLEPWRKQQVGEQKPFRYGLALLVMVVMGWAMRHTDDDEAFGFGFIPIFLLTTMSYYYYIARLTLVIVHAADLSRARNVVGLAMLLGIELFTNWAESTYSGHRVFLIGYLAWALAAYTLVMMGFLLYEARRTPEVEAP